jgi:hypothetical protein
MTYSTTNIYGMKREIIRSSEKNAGLQPRSRSHGAGDRQKRSRVTGEGTGMPVYPMLKFRLYRSVTSISFPFMASRSAP